MVTMTDATTGTDPTPRLGLAAATPCRADLEQLGFTPEQIARLDALRAAYPLIEFVSIQECQRLAFLKWRVTHQPNADGA